MILVHMFYRAICDHPGCTAELAYDGDRPWAYDVSDLDQWAADTEWARTGNLGDRSTLKFYCPEHSHWDEDLYEQIPNEEQS